MPFAVPMVYRETSNHNSDCYFCLTPPVASGMNRKKKQRIGYPNIPSAIKPVPHGRDLPVPEPSKEYNLNSEMEDEDMEKTGPHEEPTDPDSQGPASGSPHKLTQNELNDLVGDLVLRKGKGRTATIQNETVEILVIPRYERVLSSGQTFVHFFVMRYLNASLWVMNREHGMPSESWLQAS